jgi:hypothetical protein
VFLSCARGLAVILQQVRVLQASGQVLRPQALLQDG